MSTLVLNAHGRPLRRPIVYLDTSTLGNAFPDAREPDPALTEVVALAASRGTLCFSVAHIIEVTAIQPREHALSMGQWLDSLDRHWLSVTTAADDELKHAVRVEMGLTTDPPRMPIYHTLVGGLGPTMAYLTPERTVPVLEDPTIAGFIRRAHGRLTESEEARQFSVQAFRMLHMDRTDVQQSRKTSEEVRTRMTEKLAGYLKRHAREALRSEPTIIGAPPVTDEAVDAAVDRLLADPLSLPINRIAQHLWGAIGERILRQSPESNKFAERYGSMAWDIRHATGAAVSDVFTCDRRVAEFMGNYRTDRGLARQLSVGGDIDRTAFAKALRRQIEAVATG